jgi:hypothetical protein
VVDRNPGTMSHRGLRTQRVGTLLAVSILVLPEQLPRMLRNPLTGFPHLLFTDKVIRCFATRPMAD